MPLASLGFLVGVLICQSLTELPVREWSFFIVILIPLALRFPEFRFAIFILLGFLYSVFIAHSKLDTQISPELAGKDLLGKGVVTHVLHQSTQRTRFWFSISDLSELPDPVSGRQNSIDSSANLPRRLQLTWYNHAPDMSVGQRWQLKLRLKQPRGFSNPGAFDYEAWLYQNAIDATGYVKSGKEHSKSNQLLGYEQGVLISIQQLREQLSQKINRVLKDHEFTAMIQALVVGDRQAMSDEQWTTLTRTGTNHLMAISGLHIGLVAGMVFLLMNFLWRRIPRAALFIAAPRVAALMAIVAALFYAALAGFSLPTQRAFIMVAVAMLATWFQRSPVSGQVLALALIVVLLFDPTAVMSGSFWLSFAAVAVIVFTLMNRTGPDTSLKKWWWKWGRVQWVIAIGLAPVLLFWFQQVPLASPVANFIAVPVVSLLTVPLSLFGACLLLVDSSLGQIVLTVAHASLQFLWPVLEAMANLDNFIYQGSKPPLWVLIPGLTGCLLLLAPSGFPARWLGLVFLLPLVFFPREQIPYGTFRFTLLDVGHGLAAVVRTQNHVMVYDVGPRYSDSFNAGEFAVIPFLKSVGINHIDRLILSHDDIDHVGGYDAVAARLTIGRLTHGQGVRKQHVNSDHCEQGQDWQWDGVRFRVLHPAPGYISTRDNNNSCIVQISTETDKLLLTGDIEREVEEQFIKYFAGNDDNLRAEVLVVPHHGSLSSSSDDFVQALQPNYALISAGYKNRYGLPKPQVLDRYQALDARILNTGHDGAISFLMGKNGLSELTLHRQQAGHYWTGVTK